MLYFHFSAFLKGSQAGFDWFVVTVFLITRGSLLTTLTILQDLSHLLTSAYVWPPRVHKSVSDHKSVISFIINYWHMYIQITHMHTHTQIHTYTCTLIGTHTYK